MLWLSLASLHCAEKITPNKGCTSPKLRFLDTHKQHSSLHPGSAGRRPCFVNMEVRPEQIITCAHRKTESAFNHLAHKPAFTNGVMIGCGGNWPAFTDCFSWKPLKCFAVRQTPTAGCHVQTQTVSPQGPSSLVKPLEASPVSEPGHNTFTLQELNHGNLSLPPCTENG